MRLRLAGVFCAGFACGLIFLAVLLWQGGRLRTINAATGQANPESIQPLRKTARPSTAQGLLIPVEGARAADLRDSFSEMRGGHRHEAIDIMAPRGTPVLAAVEGNVVKLFLSKPGGLTVYQFDVSSTYCYYYAHLDRYAPDLKAGMLLRRGDVLGYVGSTGDASPSAPHLHFAIFKLGPEKRWWEGTPIDPFGILTGSASVGE